MNLQNEKAIKIAFFDIDGTLIDMNRKNISDQMLDCLIRLKENDIILCIATGRPPASVPHFPGIGLLKIMLSFVKQYEALKVKKASNSIPGK